MAAEQLPDGVYDWNRAGIQVTAQDGNVFIPDDSSPEGGIWVTGEQFLEYNRRVDRQEADHARAHDRTKSQAQRSKAAVDSFADLVRKD